jgi:hypothetical protein
MIGGGTKFLGLAIGDRRILAAEVRLRKEERSVARMAEFAIPAEAGWEKPEALGSALRHFLRQNHFSASGAVVGVPARWLMAREREVPPASASMAAATLRLQAERLFSPELKDLVFDYAGESSTQEARKVLLVAVQQQQLGRIEQMAETAGVRVLAVTSSALALASSLGDELSLIVGADAVELVVGAGGAARALKYLSAGGMGNGDGAAGCAAIGTEIRRAVALLGGDSRPQELAVWDGLGLDAEQRDMIGERSGLKLRMPVDLGRLQVGGVSGGELGRYATAVALALAGAERQASAVDFLHSKLAAPRKQKISRRTMFVGAAVAAVVFGGVYLGIDLRNRQTEVDDMNASLAEMKPHVDAVQGVANKVTYGRGWYEVGRPPYLSCMKEFTEAFGQDGQVWATTFTWRENRKGTLAGKAGDQKSILAVLDKLKTNRHFGDVKLQDMRDAGGRSREVSFSMSFTFNAVE